MRVGYFLEQHIQQILLKYALLYCIVVLELACLFLTPLPSDTVVYSLVTDLCRG